MAKHQSQSLRFIVGLCLSLAGISWAITASAVPASGAEAPKPASAAATTDVKATDAKATDAKATDAKATPEVQKQPLKSDKKDKAKADAATSPSPSTAPSQGTVVEIKTTAGSIKVELADKEAPVSVKNFLSYVSDKFYDGLIFHRVIKDFMIQGGGYSMEGDKLVEKATKAPIVNEAKNGLKNNRGTIAMARTQDPNSATAQFYINHANNNNLDYPSFDGHGYAVFGKVVDGMDVVDAIASAKTGVRGGMPDVPLTDIKIISIQAVKAAGH